MSKELVKAPTSLSVWENNMRHLARRQSVLNAVLFAYVQEHGHEFPHFETKTPEGTWIEGLSPEPFFQPDSDPVVPWKKSDRDSPIFMQFGIGAPPYLFKVIRSLPKEALSLIVVEPNIELIAYTLHMTSVFSALPQGTNITFVTSMRQVPDGVRFQKTFTASDGKEEKVDVSDEKDALYYLNENIFDEAMGVGLRTLGLYTVSLMSSAVHAGEESVFRDDMDELLVKIKQWLSVTLSVLGNSAEDTLMGMRQMALSSPWNSLGYQLEDVKKVYAGRPCVIVSAGPSLSKNFEQLRGIEDKCLILANDAVLYKLLSAGIRPHIVCALERGMPTFDLLFKRCLRDFPDECAKILLVSQAVCVPKLFGLWPGPKIVVSKQEVPLDGWVCSNISGQPLLSGSSVAHMCLGVAMYMGVSSCALIGQDLAYGDTGETHADEIFDKSTSDAHKMGSGNVDRIKVPGALGGEVETYDIWLSFLRVLEQRVPLCPFDVYDCTEGGALIKGTKIVPFADHISEHIAPCDPIAETAAEVVRRAGVVKDKESRCSAIKANIEESLRSFGEARTKVDEIESIVERVCAPGLSPERRKALASEASGHMDDLNRLDPVFAFVGQSYSYLATSEIALTRFLDTVELVERWRTVHMDMITAHKYIIAFVLKWLRYALDAITYYKDRELPLEPLSVEDARAQLDGLLARAIEGRDLPSSQIEMDALFSRVDFESGEWEAEELWNVSNYLLTEGRSDEASRLMKIAKDELEGRELPTEAIYVFLKDMSRALITRDLLKMPEYDMVDLLLENAVDLMGEDDEIRELRKEQERAELASMTSAAIVFGAEDKYALEMWCREKIKARRAMSANDPLAAFELIWNGIREYGVKVPGYSQTEYGWLVAQVDKFLDVEDEHVVRVIDAIVDGIANDSKILTTMRAGYSHRFLEALREHGADIIISAPAIEGRGEMHLDESIAKELETAEVEA